jgi:hypothetical protein
MNNSTEELKDLKNQFEIEERVVSLLKLKINIKYSTEKLRTKQISLQQKKVSHQPRKDKSIGVTTVCGFHHNVYNIFKVD